MTNQAKPNLSLQPASIRLFLYLLLALALIRGIIYASVVPPWQAPDEPPQFERARAALNAADWNSTSTNGPTWYNELIRSLFTFNFWDYIDDNRPTYSPDAPLNQYIAPYHEVYSGLYSSRPAYAVIGWPILLVPHQDIVLQLYLVRLNTVFMNLGVITLAYLITRTLFPDNLYLTLGVPILILFNPQHTHLLSTVNNGNLAELLATAALFFIVKGVVRGFTWLIFLTILVLSLAAMWTKATAYFLPFVLGIVGLFYLWQYRHRWYWLIPAAVIAAGLGYYLAPSRLGQVVAQGWVSLQSGGVYLDPIVPIDLFRSFWAMPGWTILLPPTIWYGFLAVICLSALAGLLIPLVKQGRSFIKNEPAKTQALVVLAAAVLFAIGTLLLWNTATNSIVYRQGRSIYPVIVPISLFLMMGWQQFLPGRFHGVSLLVVTAFFFLLDTTILFHYIIPIFYSRY